MSKRILLFCLLYLILLIMVSSSAPPGSGGLSSFKAGPVPESTFKAGPVPESTFKAGPMPESTFKAGPVPESTFKAGSVPESISKAGTTPKSISGAGTTPEQTSKSKKTSKSTHDSGKTTRSTSNATTVNESISNVTTTNESIANATTTNVTTFEAGQKTPYMQHAPSGLNKIDTSIPEIASFPVDYPYYFIYTFIFSLLVSAYLSRNYLSGNKPSISYIPSPSGPSLGLNNPQLTNNRFEMIIITIYQQVSNYFSNITYIKSLIIITLIFVSYLLTALIVGVNFNSDMVSDITFFIKVILLYLLFISNWHLFIVLREDMGSLNKMVTKICGINVNIWNYSVEKEGILFLMSLILFSIYFYVILFSPCIDENIDSSLYLDIKENSYQIDASAEPIWANIIVKTNNIWHNISEINLTMYEMYRKAPPGDAQNYLYSIYLSCGNATSYMNKSLSHLSAINERKEFFIDAPDSFKKNLFYGFRFIKYENKSDLSLINRKLSKDLETIDRASIDIEELNRSYNSTNMEDTNDTLLTITSIINASCYNSGIYIKYIDSKSRPFDKSGLFTQVRAYGIALIFDIIMYSVTLFILILFTKNYLILFNLLHYFIKNIKNAPIVNFNNSEDLDRIKTLRDLKAKLNSYIVYLIIILILSVSIYILMKDDFRDRSEVNSEEDIYSYEHFSNSQLNNIVNSSSGLTQIFHISNFAHEKSEWRYFHYIEAILISIYVFIILSLSSLSFRKMSLLMDQSVKKHKEKIEAYIFESRNIKELGDSQERLNILKNIDDEFSLHKNILSFFSVLAPLATLIFTYWHGSLS